MFCQFLDIDFKFSGESLAHSLNYVILQAFFAGDRTKSMHSMEDALQLFIKLGNQKAIGVAYNNVRKEIQCIFIC